MLNRLDFFFPTPKRCALAIRQGKRRMFRLGDDDDAIESDRLVEFAAPV